MADPAPVPVPSEPPQGEPARHAFRTYASDVAALTGKPLPKDIKNEPAPLPQKPVAPKEPEPVPEPAAPAPPPPPPPEPPHYDPPPAPVIPKAPSTEESREAVLARLKRRAEGEVPAPQPPVATPLPKAPSTSESREQVLARLKAKAVSPAQTTETPAPVSAVAAAAAAAPDPSPIHTYKSDFAGKSGREGASRIAVLAAEQDARRGAPAPLPPQKKPQTLVYVGGGLLILAGIGSMFAAYLLATGKPPIPQELAVPSLIFADERAEIAGEGEALRNAFVALSNEPLSEGKVRIAYRLFSTTTPEGLLSVPEDGGTLIGAFSLPAPGVLLRNIERESVPGIIAAAGEARPFLILRVSSYERSFAGMLEWEASLENDLSDFYPPHPDQLPPPAPTASSTPELSLPQTSLSLSAGFVDEVVANRDVRMLRDADGRVVLLYGYRDKRTLIIARSPEAFTELVARLAASASR